MQPLPYEKHGNEAARQMLVFLHGWPDKMELWNSTIKPFQNDCFILNVSYPNYSQKEVRKWGADFDEITHRLKVTVDNENTSGRKVIFVTHDWGAFFGYNFDRLYPGYLSDMIALDLSPRLMKPSIAIFLMFYLMLHVVIFLIGGRIGNLLSKVLASCALYFPPYWNEIQASWSYPYFYVLKNAWDSIFKGKKFIFNLLNSYTPSCPIAYLWGTQKPIQFHTDAWIKKLKADPRNIAKGVKSLHWIMRDELDFLCDVIRLRLRQTISTG